MPKDLWLTQNGQLLQNQDSFLYAAFINKEELFHKALDLYMGGPANGSREALQETTARAVVKQLLNRLVGLLSDPHHPAGCLLVKGGLSSAKADDSIHNEMIKRRLAGENALRERFERAKAEGDLPANSDPAGLAFYVTTITQGMTVQAVNGTDENELRRFVEMVLQTWPSLVEIKKLGGKTRKRVGGCGLEPMGNEGATRFPRGSYRGV